MRIVNAATFLAMPAGTVFAKITPSLFGELMVKCETNEQGNDFYYVSPTDQVDGLGILTFEPELALEEGTPVPLDFNTVMRDGLKDMSQVYAVWERKDVEGLIGRLSMALQDGYPLAAPEEDGKQVFEIWVQGFTHTHAGELPEKCLGRYQAATFDEAMGMYLADMAGGPGSPLGFHKCETTGRWYWHDLAIYDNETKARKNSG